MTVLEQLSLAAQWVSAAASVGAVVVAAVFGILTLANNRNAMDAQQRAALALDEPPVGAASANRGLRERPTVTWTTRRLGNATWELVNLGPGTAADCAVTGGTDQDTRRIRAGVGDFALVKPHETIPFRLRSFWGAAAVPTVVVSWRYAGDEERFEQKVPVVA